MQTTTCKDALRLERQARACARWVALRARRVRPHPLRPVLVPAQALAVWLRRLFRDHWDVGVFDLAFGSVKAFGVYPALFGLGLAWTIPLLEYAPLNTQLWTAAYLVLRRRIASRWGARRFGIALLQLDRERERILGPSQERAHVFEHAGRRCTLRVEGSHLRSAWRRLRGLEPEPGSIALAALRRCVEDPEQLAQARALRVHDSLYERVLIECALGSEGGSARLLGHVRRASLAGPAPLGGLVQSGHVATRARIAWVAGRHAARVTRRAGRLSRAGLALRWLGWSYQRAALRALAEVEQLEYALLADVHRGLPWQRSPRATALARARARLAGWIRRLESFAQRARAVARREPVGALVTREIETARGLGLTVRLARAARHADTGFTPACA